MKALILCSNGKIVVEGEECEEKPISVLSGEKREKLSKRLSGILRHFPEKYNIVLDEYGWAFIESIVKELKKTPLFQWVEKWHVLGIALYDPKERFQLNDEKTRIRARYGHSIQVKIIPIANEIPPILFHGTTNKYLKGILSNGISSMKRKWVHLTDDIKQAEETAKRHSGLPVILKIDTKCLRNKGYNIYKVARNTFLVKHVPKGCIVKAI